jgi:hypothetical protein
MAMTMRMMMRRRRASLMGWSALNPCALPVRISACIMSMTITSDFMPVAEIGGWKRFHVALCLGLVQFGLAIVQFSGPGRKEWIDQDGERRIAFRCLKYPSSSFMRKVDY